MRSAIIVFPGSNCDRDLAVALQTVTGRQPDMVWHRETSLSDYDFIGIGGGYSYGDYLRPGAIASRSPIVKAVAEAAERGAAVLGVCNGFQILTEAGLLPGALMRNAGLAFLGKSVDVTVEQSDTPFTRAYREGERICLPIAHHDGAYFADDETLDRLEGEGQVIFRYAHETNGSQRRIAGVANARRNVLGLMPHPERAVDPLLGPPDGRALFESLVNSLS